MRFWMGIIHALFLTIVYFHYIYFDWYREDVYVRKSFLLKNFHVEVFSLGGLNVHDLMWYMIYVIYVS